MRVGLPHFGQSVLFEVSITFWRSAVLAILAIKISSYFGALAAAAAKSFAISATGRANIARAFSFPFSWKACPYRFTHRELRSARSRWDGRMTQKDLELAASILHEATPVF